jgi:spore coat polysaccharide biosynthesis protein SpsF
MGGGDPAGLTLKAVRALEQLALDFEPRLVLGGAFSCRPALDDLLARASRSYTVLEDVSEMAPVMQQATLAMASFGVTAYELAALGIPAIHLCLTDDHALSATALADAQMAISLGHHERVSEQKLAASVADLLANAEQRAQFSCAGRKHLDGCGAARIAAMLVGWVQGRYFG